MRTMMRPKAARMPALSAGDSPPWVVNEANARIDAGFLLNNGACAVLGGPIDNEDFKSAFR